MAHKCQHCGKPTLPGEDFCSLSCDAGSVMCRKPGPRQSAGKLAPLLTLGLLSVTVRAVEFDPPIDTRGPSAKNQPVLWEARISNGANGDVVARRADPDEALADVISSFRQHKKPATRKPASAPVDEPEDDVSDLI